MNKNQPQEKNFEKSTRVELRRKQKSDAKMEKSNEKKKNARKSPKTQEREALLQNAEEIMKNLKSIWKQQGNSRKMISFHLSVMK